MSFYQKRFVLIKPAGDENVLGKTIEALPMLYENNKEDFFLEVNGESWDMESITDISSNDTVGFVFEYYSADAFKAFEELMNMISGQNKSGALVAYDSDYGSYIQTFGDYESTEMVPSDENWVTGAIPQIIASMPTASLCELLGCDMEEAESSIEEYDPDELAETVFGEEASDAGLEFSDFLVDDEMVMLMFYTDLLRGGTIDDLQEQLSLFKRMAQTVECKGGSLLIGQEDIKLDPETGTAENIWISETGFNELRLNITNGEIGEFEAYSYSL